MSRSIHSTNPRSSPLPIVTLATTLALAALAAPALAQTDLYSNAGGSPTNPGLSTGSTSLSGGTAPAGATWSEVPRTATEANAIAGFSCQGVAGSTGGFRLADDFTVTSPGGWLVDSLALFAYQADASGAISPFSAVNLRIWKGRPGDAGSVIVFGDASNRLTGATSIETFRIFSSTASPFPQAPEPERLIWKLNASTLTTGQPVLLKRGTYWLDWQVSATAAGAEAMCPPVTAAGNRGSGNARSLGLGGTWSNAIDPGKPMSAADAGQTLPFLIRGQLHCPADVDNGSGEGLPDNAVDVSDLVYFLTAFEAGTLDADLDNGSNQGQPDDAVDVSDLLYFLTSFEAGC